MAPVKIISESKSKNGTQVTLRYPTKDDTQVMCDYINSLSDERTYISFQGEHMTLEEEQQYLNNLLEKFKEHKCLQILAFVQDKLIGTTSIDMGERTSSHIGNFGISVAKDFRGQGIGKLLMQTALDEAVKEIPNLQIVTLGVFSNNDLAKKMYEDFGFVEYGRLPQGVKLEAESTDHVHMYKVVKK
ncbi:MAG: GNAT family N-acetyltransferase [Candidatus Curtissbacteria bacterium]